MASAMTPSRSSGAVPCVRLRHRHHGVHVPDVHDRRTRLRLWGLANVRMFVAVIVGMRFS